MFFYPHKFLSLYAVLIYQIYSGTGPADGDYEDVRCFRDAASKGIKRYIALAWFMQRTMYD